MHTHNIDKHVNIFSHTEEHMVQPRQAPTLGQGHLLRWGDPVVARLRLLLCINTIQLYPIYRWDNPVKVPFRPGFSSPGRTWYPLSILMQQLINFGPLASAPVNTMGKHGQMRFFENHCWPRAQSQARLMDRTEII